LLRRFRLFSKTPVHDRNATTHLRQTPAREEGRRNDMRNRTD
jgi:hypothetical protein